MKSSKYYSTDPISAMDSLAPYSQHSKPGHSAGEPEEQPLEGQEQPSRDAAVFDKYTEMEQQRQEELDGLWRMISESNYKIQQAAEALKPLYPEPRNVPSVLGLPMNAAAGRLQLSELSIGRVSQQYHPNVPAGHIITQIPGPGGTVSKKSGVQVIISKGPPPEKERYDIVRKKERVAYSDGKGKSRNQWLKELVDGRDGRPDPRSDSLPGNYAPPAPPPEAPAAESGSADSPSVEISASL